MSTTISAPNALAREIRATALLAAPLIVAQISALGQSVIETLLAGHYDAHVLGAVAIGANLAGLPLMAMLGTMYAVPPSVSQLDGAGRRGEVGALFIQALWTGLFLGLIALAALRWGAPVLLTLVGMSESLAVDVTAFLDAVSFAMPALGLFFACRGLSDGLSMPVPTMVMSLAGLVLLGPVGYALMHGSFGLPAMGAAGTGLAGAIVDGMQAVAFIAWIARARRYQGIGLATAPLAPDAHAILGLLRVGVPMGLNVAFEIALFSLAALAAGRFGEVAAGAHQVALNFAGLAFMVPLGMANAMTVRVGRAVGQNDRAGTRRAGIVGLCMVLATQTLSSAVILTIPVAIASLYTDDPAVIATGAMLLGIAGIFQLSDGIQVACNGALRGLKDTRVPLAVTAFAYWGVGAPLGLYLGFSLSMGVRGIWVGLTAGLTVAALLLFARFMALTRLARVPSRI